MAHHLFDEFDKTFEDCKGRADAFKRHYSSSKSSVFWSLQSTSLASLKIISQDDVVSPFTDYRVDLLRRPSDRLLSDGSRLVSVERNILDNWQFLLHYLIKKTKYTK